MKQLTDDVMERFPETENVTACVDSALLLYDGWQDAAANLRQAPEAISSRLVTDNIVLDSLRSLHEKHGDRVKILFTCSTRDNALQEYQSYIRKGAMMQSKENSAASTKRPTARSTPSSQAMFLTAWKTVCA